MEARAMDESLPHRERLLILAKTYPFPSTQYRETVCVAAVNEQGLLRRLYPVPFRFLDGDQQFRKWEWIEATISKANKDDRPESFKIDADSIVCTRTILPTHHAWRERTRWIEPHISPSFAALKQQQQKTGKSLGFLRPSTIEALHITKSKDPEWTSKQIYNLQRIGWFDGIEARNRPELNKVPYDFHYEFRCGTGEESEHTKHMITDWEAGALFWNCQTYGERWEDYFRQKYEISFRSKDLIFMMGTVHRRSWQWLIIGVVYPPKHVGERPEQLSLF